MATEQSATPQYQAIIAAPEFIDGLDWLNTEKPLKIKTLSGKILLLDFWTYCCINCMHALPDLKKLESKYPQELVVIGIHSPKFTSEKDSENIRQAVMRYEITHPVANDRDMVMWNRYGVQAWPTLVLIDPNGKIVGSVSGQDVYDVLDNAIAQLIKICDSEEGIDRRPLDLKLKKPQSLPRHFPFPARSSPTRSPRTSSSPTPITIASL